MSVLASSLVLGQSLGDGSLGAQAKSNLDLPYDATPRLQFYGEDFEGDGVVFVVDRSGSMQDSGELDVAKREVARNIAQLSPRVEFAVVFFDANLLKWPSSGGPVAAEAAQKTSAIGWVTGIPGGGGSCVQQGMAAGVDFANKTTAERPVILYVGDGGGTCRGAPELTYLTATLASVAKLNFRMAKINTIGVLDIPLIHVSVTWLRSLHPEAVILSAENPVNLEGSMGATIGVGLLAFTFIFASLFLARYLVSGYEHEIDLRDAGVPVAHGAEA